MASTLTCILVHITFSTRLRVPLIPAAREDALYAFIGGVCRRVSSPLLAAGGTPDHVHLLVSLHKTIALAKLLLEIKRDTSRWMKSGPDAVPEFAWQDGYFGFSVSASNSDAVRRYIGNQKEHHAKADFMDEVRLLLRRHGIEWNEEYIWR